MFELYNVFVTTFHEQLDTECIRLPHRSGSVGLADVGPELDGDVDEVTYTLIIRYKMFPFSHQRRLNQLMNEMNNYTEV